MAKKKNFVQFIHFVCIRNLTVGFVCLSLSIFIRNVREITETEYFNMGLNIFKENICRSVTKYSFK